MRPTKFWSILKKAQRDLCFLILGSKLPGFSLKLKELQRVSVSHKKNDQFCLQLLA